MGEALSLAALLGATPVATPATPATPEALLGLTPAEGQITIDPFAELLATLVGASSAAALPLSTAIIAQPVSVAPSAVPTSDGPIAADIVADGDADMDAVSAPAIERSMRQDGSDAAIAAILAALLPVAPPPAPAPAARATSQAPAPYLAKATTATVAHISTQDVPDALTQTDTGPALQSPVAPAAPAPPARGVVDHAQNPPETQAAADDTSRDRSAPAPTPNPAASPSRTGEAQPPAALAVQALSLGAGVLLSAAAAEKATPIEVEVEAGAEAPPRGGPPAAIFASAAATLTPATDAPLRPRAADVLPAPSETRDSSAPERAPTHDPVVRDVAEIALPGFAAPTAAPRGDATIVSAPPSPPVSTPADMAVQQQLAIAQDGMWLDQLARDIARSAAGGSDLHFKLDPVNLGNLTVRIAQVPEGTSIRLTADSEQARTILTDAQPRLIAEARAQGLKVSDTQVDLSNQGGSGGASAWGQTGGQQQGARQQPATPLPLHQPSSVNSTVEEPARPHRPAGERYA